jgi:hypothetical protein
MGLFQYDRGHLSHAGMATRLGDAMRRGALSAAANHSIDFLAVDWFEHADEPVESVRNRLGIVAKDWRAIDAGSVTPWERGGISPYQFHAGARAAEEAGRSYDSFGAEPDESPP